MSVSTKIKKRLPGGELFEPYIRTGQLRGTKFEYAHTVYREAFFFGRRGKQDELSAQGIQQFRNSDCYDFEIIKVPADFPLIDVSGVFLDLIAPYLAGTDVMSREGTYEAFGVEVHEGDVVIDAGANIGIFSAFAAKYRGGFVHAFEPVDSTAELLERLMRFNDISSSVVVSRAGLSDYSGEAEIAVFAGSTGGNTLVEACMSGRHIEKREKVRLITIDDYVRDNHLERVDFIKADIEGSERNMLKGATETLKTFAPQLAICTYHLPDDKEVLTDIIKKANPRYSIKYGRMKLYAKVE